MPMQANLIKLIDLYTHKQKGVVMHAFNPITWEAEAGASMFLRPF